MFWKTFPLIIIFTVKKSANMADIDLTLPETNVTVSAVNQNPFDCEYPSKSLSNNVLVVVFI